MSMTLPRNYKAKSRKMKKIAMPKTRKNETSLFGKKNILKHLIFYIHNLSVLTIIFILS